MNVFISIPKTIDAPFVNTLNRQILSIWTMSSRFYLLTSKSHNSMFTFYAIDSLAHAMLSWTVAIIIITCFNITIALDLTFVLRLFPYNRLSRWNSCSWDREHLTFLTRIVQVSCSIKQPIIFSLETGTLIVMHMVLTIWVDYESTLFFISVIHQPVGKTRTKCWICCPGVNMQWLHLHSVSFLAVNSCS